MRRQRLHGFTLVELVIVIALLSIISLVTVGFITSSMQGYADVKRRDQLSSAARVAVERMAREVRNALPNSIRISADNTCLEFIPTVAASRYMAIPTSGATPSNSFSAVAFAVPPVFNTGRVAVYPIDSNNLDEAHVGNPIYDVDANSIISPILTSTSAELAPVPTPASGVITVNLNAVHNFPTGSPSNRFFIVEEPVSFCVVGTDLYRFQGEGSAYTYTPVQANAASLFSQLGEPNRAILASDIINPPNNTPFRYVESVLQRNGLVLFDLFVEDQIVGVDDRVQENIQVQFDVQVRNVP